MKILHQLIVVLNIFFIEVNSYLHLDWDAKYPALDPQFHEQFLSTELCLEQLAFIRNDAFLALKFIESGLRVPRSMLEGNLIDLGNYHQCLKINHQRENDSIEGKYCLIQIPINQEFDTTGSPSQLTERPVWSPELPNYFDSKNLKINSDLRNKIVHEINKGVYINMEDNITRSVPESVLQNLAFRLAVCVPKVCTTKQWMEGFIFNLTTVGLQYTDEFCRVKDDKPWVPADYVAIVVFSILGFITLLSTCYDIWHRFYLKSDPEKVSSIRRCFSLYTNGIRLTTFKKVPGTLECIDGIRAISMFWVVFGHSFSTLPPRLNLLESLDWALSFRSTFLTSAPICVDTFFMLSGLLLVYTTATKMTSIKLLKNIHLFYLHRILRMFPLLGAAVLIQASFLYRMADGPIWTVPVTNTENCRKYWWSTLLYLQTYFNPSSMCLQHSWYLAIDMHLHILSPLVLFWVLSGKKKAACIALTCALITWLAASTTYNFIKEFPGSVISATRNGQRGYFMDYYYVNTLTRAPPFFVGLVFGYLLHLFRGRKVEMSKFTSFALWISAFALTTLGILSNHPAKNEDWDNQTVDSLINSFARTVWSVGVGWMIFACSNGLGGPINWFLSLQMFKLPSRISYAMYIFHLPLMYLSGATATETYYFTEMKMFYRFFSELVVTLIAAFVMTIFIDSPFSTIFKLILVGGDGGPINNKAKTGTSKNKDNQLN